MPLSPARPTRWQTGLFLSLLALALLLAYSDSFTGPYLFDDTKAIPDNATIRHLGTAFIPPTAHGNTVGGRPLLNLSLALNFALNRALFGSGLDTTGYHLVNLLIHFAAASTLYGLLWRTLLRTPCAGLAFPAAAGAALLWALHPVQTEAVTYIVQRAESLAGLLLLLSLYGFVRSVEKEEGEKTEPHARRWQILSVAAAALGMTAKETVAVLPFLVWLYDRAFVTQCPGFLAPLRRRPRYYAALAATWLLLLLCLSLNPGRGNTAGFEIAMPWWRYGLAEFHAVVHYLRLVVWPHPLVFDYGETFVPQPPLSRTLLQALPWIAILLPLLALCGWAAVRRPRIGYAGIWFFLILAPTSTILPLYDPVWEHRLYLSLAPPLLLISLGLCQGLGHRAVWAFALLTVLAAGATFARNLVWRNEVVFWSDSVAKVPDNHRSQNNLGTALCRAGRLREAEAHLLRATELRQNYAEAWNNLGTVLYLENRHVDAEAALREALLLNPVYVDAHNNLGSVLLATGHPDLAGQEFAAAATIAPRQPDAYLNLGFLCLKTGRPAEALSAFEAALRLAPDHPRIHAGIGIALALLHRPDEAARFLRRALQLNPNDAEAREQLDRLHLSRKDI